jgi:hypothetical protein
LSAQPAELRLDQRHPRIAARAGEPGVGAVGDEKVDVRHPADPDRGRAVELSSASKTWRACRMIVCDTRTSSRSKSRKLPSGSIADAPIRAKSTLNARMQSIASAPTIARSPARTRPPATMTSIVG